MDLKNKIFTPYKKGPIHWRNTKMVNNILKIEKSQKIENLPMQLIYSAI
ncbi:hypothetical protein [Borreliella yangtzensis]|uniref:Uncharacterized protein n=2 Tax=Borreliella yangtzensis TaxID=683292 RepID=A0ABR6P9P8_9SPIR|nr:hypothetical protein [Borreliella yangtzensis]